MIPRSVQIGFALWLLGFLLIGWFQPFYALILTLVLLVWGAIVMFIDQK